MAVTPDHDRSYDFAQCKICKHFAGKPTYVLPSGTVYCCKNCRFHYLNSLDDIDSILERPLGDPLKHFAYIDSVLHAHDTKFVDRLLLLKRFATVRAARCLDIGAGGGLFLSLLRAEGALVEGIEPDPLNRLFAEDRYQLSLVPELVDSARWQEHHQETFDIVTLWDVVEHLNFPKETLAAAARLLKSGGLLCVDTPFRDAFLYRTGELAYRSTRGRATTLLRAQYSSEPFGHKQIFSTSNMRDVLISLGFRILHLERIHELSFPYHVYLRRILRSHLLARTLSPFAAAFFRLAPVRNKMILLAAKQ